MHLMCAHSSDTVCNAAASCTVSEAALYYTISNRESANAEVEMLDDERIYNFTPPERNISVCILFIKQ